MNASGLSTSPAVLRTELTEPAALTQRRSSPAEATSVRPLHRPLRIAVVTEQAQLPQYAIDAICAALVLPEVELAGVFTIRRNQPTAWPRRLFAGLDALEHVLWACRGRGDIGLVGADVATALTVRRLGELELHSVAGQWVPDRRSVERLRALDLDMLFCLGDTPIEVPSATVRHAAVGVELGRGVSVLAPWAGAAELSAGTPFLDFRLVDYAVAGGKVIYAATNSLVGTSVSRNRRNALTKGAAALRRLLRRLAQGGSAPLAPPSLPSRPDSPHADSPAPPPSLPLFAQTCARIGRCLLRNRLDAKVDEESWHIAYAFSDTPLPDIPFDSLSYLAPPPGTYWADPFALIHESRHYIFFEEFVQDIQRGRLLAVEVAEGRGAGAPMPVLERDCHLSYPQVFHWDGNLYMVPETKQARRIELLRCVQFPSRWETCAVLLDGVRAVDATLWRQDGLWWMLANVALDGIDTADELHLYCAEDLFGQWTPHPANPLCADVRYARPAGPVFSVGGETYRPSQDGATQYGAALWINRVERLDKLGYRETPVRRIAPDWHPDISRVHTLGRAGRLTVLDCVVAERRGGLMIQRSFAAAAPSLDHVVVGSAVRT